MKKSEVEKLVKGGNQDSILNFFKNIPNHIDAKKYLIYCKISSGSGCDSPIINKHNGVYTFDSYGMSFKNWRDWESVIQYGACGTSGKTNRLKCVANSCISFNRDSGRVALISEDVYSDLKNEGYNIVKLKVGFR